MIGLRWRLFGRIGFLLLCLSLIRPATKLVDPGPTQQVVTNYPTLGIHTRLIDEVEPWKIKRSLEMSRELGAGTIVELFPWAYIEKRPGRYDWQQPDMIVRYAEAQGLQIVARLDLVPAWARPEETSLTYLDADYYAAFADFAARFADRYAGEIEHIVLWNEPNLAVEWGERPPDPEAYAKLIELAATAIKEVNPDVVVLAGGLAPTLEPEGSAIALDDLIFLRRWLGATRAVAFDGLAVHVYGTGYAVDAPPKPTELNVRRLELQQSTLSAFGLDNMPLYVTEAGFHSDPTHPNGVTIMEQAALSAETLRFAAEHWPSVKLFAFWLLRTPAPTENFNDYFTFVDQAFRPKPLYRAIQQEAIP